MRFKPTFEFTACRIKAVNIAAQADGLSTITIVYTKVRDPNVGWPQEFIGGPGFTSWRLQRLLSAVGIVGELTEPDQLIGRYFAIKDGGSQPDDFASLEYASACLQSDRQAFEAAKAYAAEEEADAAMEAYLETGIEAFSRKASRRAG